METLTQEQVIAEIRAKVQASGGTSVAVELNVSRQYLYKVLTGFRAPGKRVLAGLKLEKVPAEPRYFRVQA